MAQDILITPGSGEPQILFRGSGTTDTTIDLNVISSQQSQSLSGSGTTTLSFEGTQGQLFSVTDNLSSGTIFSVSDITGLPLIEVDASGDVKIGEYGRYVGIGSGIAPGYGLDVFSSGHFHKGFILASYTPATTTNALYNVGGTLTFDGSTVGGGLAVASGSKIQENAADIILNSASGTNHAADIIRNAASGTATNTSVTNLTIELRTESASGVAISGYAAYAVAATGATNAASASTNSTAITALTTELRTESASGVAISGYAVYAVAATGATNAASASTNATAIIASGNVNHASIAGNTTNITTNATAINASGNANKDYSVAVSGWTVAHVAGQSHGGGGSSYTAGSGLILADNKFHMSAAQTIITSLFATDIKIGEDDGTKIDFGTPDQIHFYVSNDDLVYMKPAEGSADSIFGPVDDSTVDLGTTSVRWKDAYVDSMTVTGNADIDGTTNLDAVDIDGNVQLDGTLTVGVDDTGYDVKLFGASPDSYLEWDESEDRLNLVGGSYVNEAVPASDTGTGVTATITLDTSLGNYHNIVMGGGGGSPTQVRTINLNNAKRGQRFILRLTQHDTSPQTVTAWLNTGSDYVYYTGTTRATVRWAGGIKPTMSTSTSHTDVYGFLCTNNAGSAFDAFIIGQDLPD